MNKFIVITSIFHPTEAVIAYANMHDYKLIVVGDKKTPTHWNEKNTTYMSIIHQACMNSELAKILPYHHYCRKMLGYLQAMESGAECIVDTDDDNIPKENWHFPKFEEEFDVVDKKGIINVYQHYTQQKIWPRGLPLHLISKKINLAQNMMQKKCRVGIWQGLVDGDPDVDAIYRLTNNQPCYFEEKKPVVLEKQTVSPFNTQNTMIRKELFPLMYLPAYVNFRFTDILRSLVAQPIMWLNDYQLGFIKATVIQKRNPHDYMQDFISEIPMYKHCGEVVDIVSANISKDDSIANNLLRSYEALHKHSIVCEQEIVILQAWLKDIENK